MTRFFKYRSVVTNGNLAEDYALQALFGSYAIFSSRTNFNDLFDSKIDIPYPSVDQVLELVRSPRATRNLADVRRWIAHGGFTPEGLEALIKGRAMLNNLFDSYAFLSLSTHNDSPLLWAHYASSHTGFCIEFEFPPDSQPNQVRYQKHIEEVSFLEFIESWLGITGEEFGERLRQALLVKLDYWAYEGEFRWFATNSMGRVPKDAKFLQIPYDPTWVKAIIFGCRTPAGLKTHIRNSLPFATEFRQAVEGKDTIDIVPFDARAHL